MIPMLAGRVADDRKILLISYINIMKNSFI
jgi:hypothetical protein